MVITINIPNITKEQAVLYLLAVNGFLAAIVKYCPTIPSKYPILIAVIKIIGRLTHNQTNDTVIRQQQDAPKLPG